MIHMYIIGIIHFIHTPVLILVPFIIDNFTTDIYYIIYFFTIMFVYTFINGECPISYTCKRMLDKHYIAGSQLTYYPEMEYVLSKKNIEYYFGSMTFLYINTLGYVIYRTNTCSYVIFTCITLTQYFLFLRNIIKIHQLYFILFQEFTKYTLWITISYLLTLR